MKITRNKLTAEQVKALPAGTKVIKVGRTRQGYTVDTVCTVVRTPRSVALEFVRPDGSMNRVSVVELNGHTSWYEAYSLEG